MTPQEAEELIASVEAAAKERYNDFADSALLGLYSASVRFSLCGKYPPSECEHILKLFINDWNTAAIPVPPEKMTGKNSNP